MYERVPEAEASSRPVATQLVRTWKLKGTTRKAKCRMVARGDLDTREDLTTSTGACPHSSVRVALMLSSAVADPKLPIEQRIAIMDVSNAYLQTPFNQEKPCFLRPPPEHSGREAGFVWKIKRCVYGLRDAGFLYEQFIELKLKSLGWKEFETAEGIWVLAGAEQYKPRGFLAKYVDDLFMMAGTSTVTELTDDIRRHLLCTPPEPPERYVGVNNICHPTGVIQHQAPYIRSMAVVEGSQPAMPLPRSIMNEIDTSEKITDKAEQTQYRKTLGEMAYVANCTRPDLQFACSWLSKFNSAPTRRAARLLLQAKRYMMATAGRGILVPKLRSAELLDITMYVDASGASEETPHPQSGYVVCVKGSPIAWKSHKQTKVARSTVKAELNAIDEGVD